MKVYRNHVPNKRQLKRRITSATCSVRTDVHQKVWKSNDKKVNEDVRQNDGHIEHLCT